MNRVHMRVLKRGVESWNDWRAQNPYTRPNLESGKGFIPDLSLANLSFANLRNADLSHICLRRADLSFANLSNAYLGYSDFTDADFADAELQGANLKGANLVEVVNLSLEQLATVKTLYNAKLPEPINATVQREFPELLRDILSPVDPISNDEWFFKVIGGD